MGLGNSDDKKNKNDGFQFLKSCARTVLHASHILVCLVLIGIFPIL